MKRKAIKNYPNKNGVLDTSKPNYTTYDLESKIKYYKKRSTDPKLTNNQKEYAVTKLKMLTTGKGRIYITDDQSFKGGKGKPRRVMVSGINSEDNFLMVNPITSSKKDTTMKLNRKGVPILQKDSYLDQHVNIKKKKGDKFTSKDLKETTSTINPWDYKKTFKFLFHSKKTPLNEVTSKNNNRLGKKYK